MKYSYIFEKCSTFVVSKEILFVFAAASPSPSEGTGASRREQRLFTKPAKAFRAEKQGMTLSGMCNLNKQCKVMAVNTIAFPVAARQNKNDDSTAYGKWFLVPYWPETLTLRGLIERVAFDQSVYSRDIVEGVLQKLTTVMVELLKSGQPVKWDGLGTFTPNINSKGVLELPCPVTTAAVRTMGLAVPVVEPPAVTTVEPLAAVTTAATAAATT